MIWSPVECAKHYICTYFVFDLFSCLPGFPLSLLIESSDREGYSGAGSAKVLKLWKVVRSLKLLKGFRLIKIGRLADEIEQHFMLTAFTMRITRLIVIILMFLHLNACFFAAMAGSSFDADGSRYAVDADTWVHVYGVPSNSWLYEYIDALYWSATTVTTVGCTCASLC